MFFSPTKLGANQWWKLNAIINESLNKRPGANVINIFSVIRLIFRNYEKNATEKILPWQFCHKYGDFSVEYGHFPVEYDRNHVYNIDTYLRSDIRKLRP